MFSNWWNKLFGKVLRSGGPSDSFVVGSGVLQGSISRGKFFNLLMDCVLNKLQFSYLGCHVHNVFAGAIAFADDLILLSPSLIGMLDMLNVCTKEFNAMGLKLNMDKCVAIIIGKCTSEVKNLLLHDNICKRNTELRYLGIMLRLVLNERLMRQSVQENLFVR